MIAAQVINDSTHADKISPVVCSVQNMHPATRMLLDCTLLGILRIFKKLSGTPGTTLQSETINPHYGLHISSKVKASINDTVSL